MTVDSLFDVLTVAVFATPVAAAAATGLSRRASLLRWLLPAAAVPGFVLALIGPVGTTVTLPWIVQSTVLGLDSIGRVFLGFTSALWLTSGWYAAKSMVGDREERRFGVFFLAAMAGNFGLILAEDVSTFYACFAIMGFASVGLVLHRNDADAVRAGAVYIGLAVVGEALIVAGLANLVATGGTTDIAALRSTVAGAGALPTVCLLLGFGIKAGALSTHFWLPLAHPAAPVPASAVLSGAMIKAGLLGWIRFLPLGAAALPTMGLALVAAGATTAVCGAVVGVTQRNPKTVLAYSSIAQMGIISVGVGIALYHPEAWTAILPAILIYATHHALAKGALFLGLDPVKRARGSMGIALAWVGLLVPAFALAGAPFTSGAVAKLALKSNLEFLPGSWPFWLGVSLPIAAVGTTGMMARLVWLVRPPGAPKAFAGERTRVSAPWAVSVVAVVVGVWMLPGSWDLLTKSLTPEKLWAAVWPLLAGAALAGVPVALQRAGRDPHTPEIPPGDVLVLAEIAARRGPAIERLRGVSDAYDRIRSFARSACAGFATRVAAFFVSAERGLSDWTTAGTCVAAAAAALLYLLRA
jgi:formate hydrogenlyase subunit 3/multisubunit Na+/H+ antiporter MnhD subunit